MALASSALRDNFDLATISTAAWPDSSTLGSATMAQTSGQAVVTLPSSVAGSHLASWRSGGGYDLTGDQVSINAVTMVSTAVAASAYLRVILDANNFVQFIQTSGTLKCQKVIAGVTTDLSSVAYSNTTHRWWKIRESGGTIFFDTSTSASGGVSWTNLTSVTIASAFAVTAIATSFGASCGNVASPGQFKVDSYNLLIGLTTTWHWTRQERPFVDRYQPVVIAATGGQGYIGISTDGTTYSWWSGPLAGDGRTLTSQPSEAAAQAMAVNLPPDGRFDLPALQEARFVKLGHRSIVNGASYTLREDYALTKIVVDQLDAGLIRGMEIISGQFTTDSLSALTAWMGALHMDGVIDIALTGGLYQGTGTFAAPATGLKLFNSAGIGKLSTYNAGVEQVTLDTDGKLYWASGGGVLDSSGMGIQQGTGSVNSITWYTGTTEVATVSSSYDGSIDFTRLRMRASSGADKEVVVEAGSGSARAAVECAYGTSGQYVSAVIGASSRLDIDTTGIAVVGAVTATSAITASNTIQSIWTDTSTNTTPTGFLLRHRLSSGTVVAGFGTALTFQADSTTTADQSQAFVLSEWSVGTHASRRARLRFLAADSAANREFLRGEASGTAPMIGLLGAAPVVRQVITGTRTGTLAQLQTAFANLLTGLANLGAITDSTA